MSGQFFKEYLYELQAVLNSINSEEFTALMNELTDTFEGESQIFVFGNGGSATTASHFACDINKGVSYGKDKRFKILCLNDNISILMAYANDISYEDVFVEQLKNFMKRDDLVIGISGSGNSKNVLKAIEYANSNGGKTFGICGFGGGRLKEAARKSLVVNSNDMQKVEDAHLIILHCTMQYLYKNIPSE